MAEELMAPLDPDAIEIEGERPDDEPEETWLADCPQCGRPIMDRTGIGVEPDPFEIGADGAKRHENCSVSRIKHEKGKIRDKRSYLRTTRAQQRAAQAREA